jgi:hypothetical protein
MNGFNSNPSSNHSVDNHHLLQNNNHQNGFHPTVGGKMLSNNEFSSKFFNNSTLISHNDTTPNGSGSNTNNILNNLQSNGSTNNNSNGASSTNGHFSYDNSNNQNGFGNENNNSDLNPKSAHKKRIVFTNGQKDILRLIGQHLRSLGLHKTTEMLVDESDCVLEHPIAENFCNLIMNGNWEEAENTLNSLKSIMDDASNALIVIYFCS